MAEEKFKLPRSSYDELCKIIKSYGRLTKPASLDEVAKLCTINKTGISANNAFLANIELIDGGKLKSATRKGKELANALEHDLPEQVQTNWSIVVRENEFLDKMAAAVKIRGKMESSALESHIAYSAGETKSGAVMTGARTVIDILRAAGVVREHEGQLVAHSTEFQKNYDSAKMESSSARLETREVTLQPTIKTKSQNFAISLHIELRIDAKTTELDGLGEKIRQLLFDLNNFEEGQDDANEAIS